MSTTQGQTKGEDPAVRASTASNQQLVNAEPSPERADRAVVINASSLASSQAGRASGFESYAEAGGARPASATQQYNQVAPAEELGVNTRQRAESSGGSAVISYEKQADAAEIANYSQMSSTQFFLKHSYRDVGRKRFHFCLSFCSVFIVVWSALVINTLVEKGPIIFLKLAEGLQGQYDGIVYPTKKFSGLDNYQNSEGVFMNYTRVMNVTTKEGKEYNLAPRKQFCGAHVGTNYPELRKKQDDGWMQEYHSTFIRTTDGKTTLPPRSSIYYNNEIKHPTQNCMMLLDTDIERNINLGTKYQFAAMDEGQCLINEGLAQQMKVEKGDIIYHKIDMYQNLIALINNYNRDVAIPERKPKIPQTIVTSADVNQRAEFPCRVAIIGNSTYGKFPIGELEDQILMEFKHFLPLLARYLPGSLNDKADFKAYLLNQGGKKIYELSDFLMMTLPYPRVKYYQSSNYFDIQKGVTGYANEIIESLGFFPVRMQLDVLKDMENFSNAILFLGLIFDIIILLFVILSILLIYSLLMISVETKTFEFGVMRMVGLSKTGLINMIILQSIMFVLPSLVMGFVMSFPTLNAINKSLFTKDMGVEDKPVPSQFAVVQALIVGLVIPLFSSIAPIQNALSKNLNESLDIQRSKTQAMYVEILDKNKANMGSYIVFGSIAVIYGLSIYYFLPLAMLSFNFSLILKIFFFILVGMLFGLSLLAFNLQRFLEIFLTYVLLFFETKSMKNMVLKNLTAHRMRNKMTSIIYSIALGFIIFLIVSYQLQIKSTQLQQLAHTGNYLSFEGDAKSANSMKPEVLEKVFAANADIIKEFTWVTPDIKNLNAAKIMRDTVSDKARINSITVGIYGVQPNVFETTVKDFLKLNWQSKSALSVGDQLYTARGSQSAGIGNYVADYTNTDPRDYNQSLIVQSYSAQRSKPNVYFRKRPLFTCNRAPAFTMRDRNIAGSNQPTVLLSLPAYNRLVSPMETLNDTKWERVMVMLKEPSNKEHIKKLLGDAKETFSARQHNEIRTLNYFDDTDTNDTVKDILDIIFTIIIVITMFLCFFSLCSSMSANLFDQTKEIGILRAIGFTRTRIKVLYFYEAFVLVMASCSLGVMIGVVVGFTMVLQQVVFTGIPLVFYFPWVQFGIIMAISIICAFASTWGPTTSLVKNQVATIFRMI